MFHHRSWTGSPTPDERIGYCLQAFENYQSKSIMKWEANAQIASTIQVSSASTNGKQRSAAGITYLAMLDKHDQLLTKASTWGWQGGEPATDRNIEPAEDVDGEIGDQRSPSPDESPKQKQCKVDKTLYAWKVQEEIVPTTLSTNIECTWSMVQNYTTDLKHALWSFQSASSRFPALFAQIQWGLYSIEQ